MNGDHHECENPPLPLRALFRQLAEQAAPNEPPYDLVAGLNLITSWMAQPVEATAPHDPCLHELFEEQAEYAPDALALIFDHSEVAYGDLNAKANQLARYLAHKEIRRGDLVGIYLDRSPIQIASLLAVLKLGAGYVMLDPQMSATNLISTLTQCPLRTVITIGGRSARLAAVDVDLTRLDVAIVGRIAQEREDNLETTLDSTAVACMTFTPDSTGVVHTHRALLTAYLSHPDLQNRPNQGFLQGSPSSAQANALEALGPLLFGGTTVLQQSGSPKPPAENIITVHLSSNDVTMCINGQASLAGYEVGDPRGARCQLCAAWASTEDQVRSDASSRFATRFEPIEDGVYEAAMAWFSAHS